MLDYTGGGARSQCPGCGRRQARSPKPMLVTKKLIFQLKNQCFRILFEPSLTPQGGPRGVRSDRELGRDRQHNQDMTIAENVRISIAKLMVSE